MHYPANALLPGAMLLFAVYGDLRNHRISNRLTLAGLLVGLGLQSAEGGLQGLTSGLLGAAVGLACFAPFYFLRAMGAGDLKLLAAVGAFLGPRGVFLAALVSLLAGGFGAIGYVLWRALCASGRSFLREGFAAGCASSAVAVQLARRDRLPFAVPIAVGGIAACLQGMLA